MGVGECGPSLRMALFLNPLSRSGNGFPGVYVPGPYNSDFFKVSRLPAVLCRMRELNIGIHLPGLFIPAGMRPVHCEDFPAVLHAAPGL